MRLLYLACLTFVFSSVHSEVDSIFFAKNGSKLAFFADVLVNADESKHRVQANNEFRRLLVETLEKENSFDYPFEELKWISIKQPVNQLFRCISWQLKLTEDRFETYCLFQMANGQLYDLPSQDWPGDAEFMSFSMDNYPAHLIYDIVQKEKNGKINYLIFGFKQLNQFTKVKVLDFMQIRDGIPRFDMNALIHDPDSERPRIKKRMIMEYSSDALATLIYNPGLDMIVFDHLIQRIGRLPNQGPTNLPDGSYEAYRHTDGEWVYVEKLYDQILEEAPRPKPVNTTRGKSIVGKKKKNQ